jgi:hypothetical protein
MEKKWDIPFDEKTALNDEFNDTPGLLPGHPRILLHERKKLLDFLEGELYPKALEEIASKLWWMSKQDHKNISALHRQIVKSRRIIITEDPKLHLVWIHDRIFIKPIPRYLLSHRFWAEYLTPSPSNENTAQLIRIRRAARGYLRTYFYLIKHESDFRIAQDPQFCLVPRNISFLEFCQFSARFDQIPDDQVSWRYAYGEIRLTRLNFYSKFFAKRWTFHRLEPQYGAYFARFYAPLLFLFGFMSVVLSAMQVEIAVEQLDTTTLWFTFHDFSRVFSVLSLVCVGTVTVLLGCLWLYKFAKEWQYALADRFFRRKDIHETLLRSHENKNVRETKPWLHLKESV